MENEEKSGLKILLDSKQSEDRNKIIHVSTQVESLITLLLNRSIGITDGESVSFGYTSQSLSLNARINLLIDFNIFTSDEKSFLLVFMEIRNKFAHNHFVQTLHGYFISEKNTKNLNFLEKKFKDKIENYNRSSENSWILFSFLVDKLQIALNKLLDHIAMKSSELFISEFSNNFYNGYLSLLDDEEFLSTLGSNAKEILILSLAKIADSIDLQGKFTDNFSEQIKNRRVL